ncbi:hypothetical protein OBBRIDRAFT_724893, partial [Obba rivulosa]
ALILADHVMTVHQEARVIWCRRFSGVTLLFHFNRWLTFVYAFTSIMLLPILFSISDLLTLRVIIHDSCTAIAVLSDTYDILLYVVWAIFSAIRVYALNGGHWLLSALVFTLAFLPAATNVVLRLVDFCYLVSVATRVCVRMSDMTVLVVTWKQTYATKRAADRANVRSPLATMLLRDGKLLCTALSLRSSR